MRRVAQGVQALGQLRVVAPARACRTAQGAAAPKASTEASFMRFAPSDPPKTSRQRSPAGIPNRARAAARSALPRAGRHRPADDLVAIAVAPLERERQVDPLRARRRAGGW